MRDELFFRDEEPAEQCRGALNRRPFRIGHALAGHPLLSLDALAAQAEAGSKRKDGFYFDAGDLAFTDKWGAKPTPNLTVAQIFDQIETVGAWIVLHHLEADPRYKALQDEFGEFFRKSIADPDDAKLLSNPDFQVFISSPRRKTPYHFDEETNFLMQIQGSKTIWICDPLDRDATTEDEIERFYAGQVLTAGNFKPHAEATARRFDLSPGEGVHIPMHAGHWVQNHDAVSVSIALDFEYPRWKYANVYQANYYLRKAGLSPRPPGRSRLFDRPKSAAISGLRAVKNLVRC
ncbi:cupin-like domain-containing protein [Methylocapsa acidiphila]|uniref:cupin-like domain-containing protein n=1 Tax=Methylocapsa acidiphila TaxID=133552 RepID=UPI00047EC82C|nr:cupin-like domain-containing protein [Methylocapsa acidiphila]